MKARIEQHRLGFRMIFLLIVQTVCLAALPNGTVAVQQISGTVTNPLLHRRSSTKRSAGSNRLFCR